MINSMSVTLIFFCEQTNKNNKNSCKNFAARQRKLLSIKQQNEYN